jgi:uncharacterized coiled-coil DUF342 family protein
MVQRKQQKTRVAAAAAASDRPARRTPSRRPADTIETLREERDALRQQLDMATARIAALEAQRDNALNRIDWVIDSLNSLLDSDA